MSGTLPCGTVCDDLWLAEHRPMPGQPSSTNMWKDLNIARQKTGVTHKPWAIGSRVLPAAGAFTTGLIIGDFANRKWLRIGLQPEIRPLESGDFYTVHGYRLTPLTVGAPISGGLGATMPDAGHILEYDRQTSSGRSWRQDFYPGVNCQFHPPPAAGWLALPTGSAGSGCFVQATGSAQGQATAMLASPEEWTVEEPVQPYTGQDGVSLNPITDRGFADVKTDVQTFLDSPRGQNLQRWYEYELGEGGAENPYTGESNPVIVTVPAPLSGETYTDYITRLQALGLVGTAIALSETAADPNFGPLEVVSTSPAPGSQVETGTQVLIRFNPETAAAPGDVSNPFDPPAIPSINLQPLSQPIGDVFPFAIFPWLLGFLGGWTGSPAGCPSFSVPFTRGELLFDFCLFEPAMEIIRPIIVVVALLSMAYFFAAAALGFSGGGNDD